MYLSYSGFKTFSSCRRSYYYKYIAKPTPSKPTNYANRLYGEVVGKLFERFYSDRIWGKDMEVELKKLVQPTLDRVVATAERKGCVFEWADPAKDGFHSPEEVKKEIFETIPRGIQSLKRHKLISPESKAEVVLDTIVDGHKIAGRADFIIKRSEPNDLVIIDGKGSRYKGKYIDARQLRWYAMLYWLRFKKIPDLLGFLYWWKGEPDMEWSKVSQEELEDLRSLILASIKEIEQAKKKLEVDLSETLPQCNPGMVFWATPGDNCKLCDYYSLCPEGVVSLSVATKEQIAEDRRCGVEDEDVSF